ncbi:MAG: UDP-glucose 4-epimerase [Planctomycetota bacterium]|nr:MAG: UDP-glucose 4-epimerase [Planctomycetota bacterium]
MLQNKTILITGGTGSFGTAMVDHLLQGSVDEIRIFSRDEAKQDAMRTTYEDSRLKFHLGDVRDAGSVQRVMKGVNMVFHAAALKQVPSCEFFPMEAVRTNVEGSRNVIDAAVAAGAESVVCLSTDKAVYPVNAMGMTKALMEKVAMAAARSLSAEETRVSCVRYGNVMYSRGSVIPLFVKQIRSGKPLTLTEPSMTRFLMPLAQAVDLVEFAFTNAEQGDLFVRKAPACTMGDLVTAMKNLFQADNEVKVIGIRHGEKLYEALSSAEELRRSEDMGDYLRVRMDGRDLNYGKFFTEGDTKEIDVEDYTSHNTEQLNVAAVEELLLSLPEIRAARKEAGL